jgi:hypothetical protein
MIIRTSDIYVALETLNKWKPVVHSEEQGNLRHGYFLMDEEKDIVLTGWSGEHRPGRSPDITHIKKYPFQPVSKLFDQVVEDVEFDRAPWSDKLVVDESIPPGNIHVIVEEDPWLLTKDASVWSKQNLPKGFLLKFKGWFRTFNEEISRGKKLRFVSSAESYGLKKIMVHDW